MNLFVLLLLPVVRSLSEEKAAMYSCISPKHSGKVELPTTIAPTYSAMVTVRDLVSNTEKYVHTIAVGERAAATVHGDGYTVNRWMFDGDTAVFVLNGTRCDHIESWSKTTERNPNPLSMPAAVTELDNSTVTWTSLNTMLTWMKTEAVISWVDDMPQPNATVVSTLPSTYKVWTGCMPLFNEVYNMSVRIAFLPANSKYKRPDVSTADAQLLFVQLLVYHDSGDDKVEVSTNTVYNVDRYATYIGEHEMRRSSRLPDGLICEHSPNSTREIPPLPTHLTAKIRFSPPSSSVTIEDKLVYTPSMLAFTYDQRVKGEQPSYMLSSLSTSGRVVHDYDYGLQYAITPADVCLSTTRLTVPPVSSITWLTGLNTTEHLHYMGRRAMGGHHMADVWSAKTEVDAKSFVVTELFFVNETTVPRLAKVLKYDWLVDAMEVPKPSILHIDSIAAFDSSVDISTCLAEEERSYVMVDVEKTSMADLRAMGVHNVRRAVVRVLASAANVSVLRIPTDDVYLKPVSSGGVVLLFALASPTTVPPSSAYPEQLSVADAISSLNETLLVKDLLVPVSKSSSITLQRESLLAVPRDIYPPLIPPRPPRAGPGAGGYIALAICMLIVGGMAGVLGAWWMWKRNRSGIAYQIYE